MSPEPCPDYRGDMVNGNLKNDESIDIKNLESKFEQLAVLWMQSDRCPSVDNNRSIWSYGSTSSDSGPPSPRIQFQGTYSDLFRPSDEDSVKTLCPMQETSIWARSDRNIVHDWLNQEVEVGRHPWMMQRKCSLDNHLSTSLFKEVTSKRSDTQVGTSYDHQLPNVPDVQVFDEDLLTSHKTHFQPIKNDSWQRELSVVIDPDRKGLVPCSPLCPNRVLTNRVNSVGSKMIGPPRPSSVSSKELASFMEPGCLLDPEEEEEKIVVIEEDDIRKETVVKSVVTVEDVLEEDETVNDENDEYQAIESILNEVLNNRSVDADYDDEYPANVQLDTTVVELDVEDVTTTNDTYASMPWMNEDLNSQIMTAETVYLTDDSDDYFLHPTSDVDSSLSDFHNDPALLFVYNRPG